MMRRLLCFLCVAAMLAGFTPACARAENTAAVPSVSAPSAVLMEKTTGTVIYEKNPKEHLFPASITKIMTMLLIVEDIEAGRLRLTDTVTASKRASTFGGSCVYLEEGEQMSVDEMLKCIAVVSANDCAVAMAEHISGSEEVFVRRMNERAAELDLKDTHFTNCTGLFDDGRHYTSAYDVALMSRELISHEMIKNYTTIWMDSIRGGEFELTNTNKLVYWYPGCTGLKTGYTSTAMYCLAATAEREGVEYIAVVMHCGSIDARNEDAKTLLNYAFASFTLCPLRAGGDLPEIPVELGKEKSVRAEYGGSEYALVRRGGSGAKYDIELLPKAAAPVRRGDRLGTLTVSIGGETVAEAPIVAAGDVERIGFFGTFALLGLSLFGL